MAGNEKIPGSPRDIELAFDVGHSSIGWAVLKNGNPVDLLGCGTVTFRADDCLASSRRDYRRQRRHIRSTRQRIKRMKALLGHLGVLKGAELDKPGCSWPWRLAATVLFGEKKLTWPELWDVLRWYAHNRGYDGNRRWSSTDASDEDTEKEENARSLMGQHRTSTMAETLCKVLGVDPAGSKKSSHVRFKGLNAAFPRNIVEAEVRRILQAHVGSLPGVDETLKNALLTQWNAIPVPEIKLPRRYQGGLLFGQLVPRFDNRIISRCPVSGEKVPSRNCAEFLRFRWAMTLANIRVARPEDRELHPLRAQEREAVNTRMVEEGALTEKELKQVVRSVTQCNRDNLETLLMHPDAKKALELDRVQKLVRSDKLKTLWPLLPERVQKRACGKWRNGKALTLRQLRDESVNLGADLSEFDAEVRRLNDAGNIRRKKKETAGPPRDILNDSLAVPKLGGRAAYARPVLIKAYHEVMAGKHPKEEGNCLCVTEEMRQAQLNRPIAEQTNNHLVRHRLMILERLLRDVVKEYAGGAKERVAQITIEVNRDLRQFSGKTAKEKAQDLGLRIANHHTVAEKLEKAFDGQTINGKPIQITAGLIRKARIAEDLGWTCPYTGQKFEPIHLLTRAVDKDHIVPRSQRTSDSLDSLVLTFAQVNKMKGKRTAMQFIAQEGGKTVADLPNLSIVSSMRFREFVDSLESYKGHDDDKRRKRNRKSLMLLESYEEKEFVPRDLTQTSQLVRLGAQVLARTFQELKEKPHVVSLPGSVTGAVRKSWNVLGCLRTAAPQVLDAEGNVKTKTEIRDITHLHHALDACVLVFAAHFVPNNGRVWELLVKRRLSPEEQQELYRLDICGFDSEGRFQIRDLDSRVKDQIRSRLAEKRVVQHIPASMSGLRVEQNMWGVKGKQDDGLVLIRQQVRQPDGSLRLKEVPEKALKLLGLSPLNGSGKLAANKGVLVIPDNFGVAILDNAAKGEEKVVIIPWHLVHSRIFKGFTDTTGMGHEKALVERNGGKVPRILRNGQLIQVAGGTYKGIWKVTSIKNQKSGVKLNLAQPDTVNTEEEVFEEAKKKKMRKVRPNCRHEASLVSIVTAGVEILQHSLAGIPAEETEMKEPKQQVAV